MSGHPSKGAAKAHGKKHAAHEEEHENHERWLVSYADMMTLLMVLFIVMFAISSVNQGKFDELKQGLRRGFGAPQTMLAGGLDILDAGGAAAPDAPPVDGFTQGGAGGTDVQAWKPASSQELQRSAALTTATAQAQVQKEVDNLKAAEKALKAALAKAGLANGATF